MMPAPARQLSRHPRNPGYSEPELRLRCYTTPWDAIKDKSQIAWKWLLETGSAAVL
jgi:hypothetical protein